MEERSKMKKPMRKYDSRPGRVSGGGIALSIGALFSLGVVGYALWTLSQDPSTGSENLGQIDEGSESSSYSGGLAKTESIEEVLGAVQVYVQNEQYEQALTVLEHAVAQFNEDQELRFALGDLYMQLERESDAYAQYIAGIEIGPSNAIAEFTAGTLANMLDRVELAEMHYGAAMRLDPSNPDTPVYLAAIQMKLNRLTDAKINLAIAGKLTPDRAQVYAMRSEIAMRENKLSIALDQIQKARVIDPDSLGWVLQEARVLKRDRKPEEAIALLVSLPDDQLMIYECAQILAECYGALGRPGDAASRLIDLSEMHPKNHELAFDIALWLERAGEREQAIEWGKRADSLGDARAEDWIRSLP